MEIDFSEAICRFEGITDGGSRPAVDLPYRLMSNSMSLRRDGADEGSPFRSDPPGEWVLLELYLPRDSGTFQLGVNTIHGLGRIWVAEAEHESAMAASVLEPILGAGSATSQAEETIEPEPADGKSESGESGVSAPALGEKLVRSGDWLPDLDGDFDLIDSGD